MSDPTSGKQDDPQPTNDQGGRLIIPTAIAAAAAAAAGGYFGARAGASAATDAANTIATVAGMLFS